MFWSVYTRYKIRASQGTHAMRTAHNITNRESCYKYLPTRTKRPQIEYWQRQQRSIKAACARNLFHVETMLYSHEKHHKLIPERNGRTGLVTIKTEVVEQFEIINAYQMGPDNRDSSSSLIFCCIATFEKHSHHHHFVLCFIHYKPWTKYITHNLITIIARKRV